MIRAAVLALALTLPAVPLFAQPADTLAASFRVYTAAGEPVALGDLVHAIGRAEVVFLGEQHDDAVAHALQLRLLEAADTLGRPVALSLEMFERDVQPVLDEYRAGLIRERDFLAAARPWGNYATDYRPLVEHAVAHGLPVLAANAPGRYVNRVARLGPESLDSLSADAKATLPPLPVAPASDSLAAAFTALMQAMAHGHAAPDSAASDTTRTDSSVTEASAAHPAHGSAPTMEHLLAAQNLRDAAMGWTLAEHLRANPGVLVVHLNGSFHSEGGLGVPEHLERYRPGTRALVVTMRADGAFPDLDPEAFRTDAGGFLVVTAPRAGE